jgi:hypothetical protein
MESTLIWAWNILWARGCVDYRSLAKFGIGRGLREAGYLSW